MFHHLPYHGGAGGVVALRRPSAPPQHPYSAPARHPQPAYSQPQVRFSTPYKRSEDEEADEDSHSKESETTHDGHEESPTGLPATMGGFHSGIHHSPPRELPADAAFTAQPYQSAGPEVVSLSSTSAPPTRALLSIPKAASRPTPVPAVPQRSTTLSRSPSRSSGYYPTGANPSYGAAGGWGSGSDLDRDSLGDRRRPKSRSTLPGHDDWRSGTDSPGTTEKPRIWNPRPDASPPCSTATLAPKTSLGSLRTSSAVPLSSSPVTTDKRRIRNANRQDTIATEEESLARSELYLSREPHTSSMTFPPGERAEPGLHYRTRNTSIPSKPATPDAPHATPAIHAQASSPYATGPLSSLRGEPTPARQSSSTRHVPSPRPQSQSAARDPNDALSKAAARRRREQAEIERLRREQAEASSPSFRNASLHPSSDPKGAFAEASARRFREQAEAGAGRQREHVAADAVDQEVGTAATTPQSPQTQVEAGEQDDPSNGSGSESPTGSGWSDDEQGITAMAVALGLEQGIELGMKTFQAFGHQIQQEEVTLTVQEPKRIRCGATAFILTATLQTPQQLYTVALKIFAVPRSKTSKEMLRRELENVEKIPFNHHTVPFFGTVRHRKRVILVSQYMSNGNVLDFLKRNPKSPRQPLAFTLKRPWSGVVNPELMVKIWSGAMPDRPEGEVTARGLTDEWWSVCNECWQKDPLARPAIEKVLDGLRTFMGTEPWQGRKPVQIFRAVTYGELVTASHTFASNVCGTRRSRMQLQRQTAPSFDAIRSSGHRHPRYASDRPEAGDPGSNDGVQPLGLSAQRGMMPGGHQGRAASARTLLPAVSRAFVPNLSSSSRSSRNFPVSTTSTPRARAVSDATINSSIPSELFPMARRVLAMLPEESVSSTSDSRPPPTSRTMTLRERRRARPTSEQLFPRTGPYLATLADESSSSFLRASLALFPLPPDSNVVRLRTPSTNTQNALPIKVATDQENAPGPLLRTQCSWIAHSLARNTLIPPCFAAPNNLSAERALLKAEIDHAAWTGLDKDARETTVATMSTLETSMEASSRAAPSGLSTPGAKLREMIPRESDERDERGPHWKESRFNADYITSDAEPEQDSGPGPDSDASDAKGSRQASDSDSESGTSDESGSSDGDLATMRLKRGDTIKMIPFSDRQSTVPLTVISPFAVDHGSTATIYKASLQAERRRYTVALKIFPAVLGDIPRQGLRFTMAELSSSHSSWPRAMFSNS
ncbi:hypothetical protein AURDEDRAFT_125971 [Auricularia subglabra TFB-10046 SS5]|nr:hypothetical protein AURDEDRAFT_125971 [Auricularia subglabra TFB-10046 SS5]